MRSLMPVLREGCDFSRKNPLIFAPLSVSEAVYGNLRRPGKLKKVFLFPVTDFCGYCCYRISAIFLSVFLAF